MKKKTLKIGFSVLVFVLVLEIAMRLVGFNSTYSERTVGSFISGYGESNKKPYHTWLPGKPIQYRQPEFSYTYMANSDGLREVEFPQVPSDSLDVVYILGDSFVEGDGAPYDSTMPRFLEKRFHADGYTRVKIYNAGMCGNDPIFAYRLLKDRLIGSKPRWVCMFTGPSDVCDLHIRGGFERFTPDGGYRYKAKPLGLDLYRYSRISRLFFHWAGYAEGMVPPIDAGDSLVLVHQIADALYKSDSLCRRNGIPFLAVGYPHPSEIGMASFFRYTDALRVTLDTYFPAVDELDISRPLADSLQARPGRFYWPINLHYNADGYRMMADVVYGQLKTNNPRLFATLWHGQTDSVAAE